MTPEQQAAEVLSAADRLLVRLDRAHLMTCSDPTDPARHTTAGDAAKVIRDLSAALAAAGVLRDPDNGHEASARDGSAGPSCSRCGHLAEIHHAKRGCQFGIVKDGCGCDRTAAQVRAAIEGAPK